MSSKCYWITGLSVTGKSTYSNMLAQHLRTAVKKIILLDGGELSQVFASETYAREERIALGMRYARLCQLLSNQSVNVVIACIGLFKEIHKWNRENIPNYVKIFIDTPVDELINRDLKVLYKKQLSGEMKNIAGIDLQVDYPKNPHVHIKWEKRRSIESMFDEMLEKCINISKK